MLLLTEIHVWCTHPHTVLYFQHILHLFIRLLFHSNVACIVMRSKILGELDRSTGLILGEKSHPQYRTDSLRAGKESIKSNYGLIELDGVI